MFRDKIRMKEVLAEAGVPLTGYRAVDHVTDLVLAVRELGFPLVVKPRLCAASVGVTVVENDADLDAFLAHNPLFVGDTPAHLMAESFVSHALFHIDGIVESGEAKNSEEDRAMDMAFGRDLVSETGVRADVAQNIRTSLKRIAETDTAVEDHRARQIRTRHGAVVFREHPRGQTVRCGHRADLDPRITSNPYTIPDCG